MNNTRLEELLASFHDKKVLVIGDVILDQYVHGVVERINPEAPVPVLWAKETEERTGGAGNVAKNIASMGAQATLVAVVGDDDAVDNVETATAAEGYATQLVRDASRPTIRKVRHLVNKQQMLRVDFEETSNVSTTVEAELKAVIAAEAAKADAIIVSDYAKGTITENVAGAVMAAAAQHKLPVMVDVKPSRVAFFKGATMIAPNRKEAHEYLGLDHLEQGGRDDKEVAQALRDKMGTNVYVTLSADGVFVCSQDGTECHVPHEFDLKVYDASGAGDVSAASMVLAYLAGAEPVEIAVLSNAASGASVEKVGTVGVTPDEIRGVMSRRAVNQEKASN